MSRVIVIILAVALGIYCFPAIVAAAAGLFAVMVGVAATIFSVAISLAVTVLPYLLFAYLIWWLVRDNRRSRQH